MGLSVFNPKGWRCCLAARTLRRARPRRRPQWIANARGVGVGMAGGGGRGCARVTYEALTRGATENHEIKRRSQPPCRMWRPLTRGPSFFSLCCWHPNPIELDFNGCQRETQLAVLIKSELNIFSFFHLAFSGCEANSDTVNDKLAYAARARARQLRG